MKITSIDRSGRASTALGTMDLRGHLPDLPSAEGSLRVGDVVGGYTWSDPANGETFLLVPHFND